MEIPRRMAKPCVFIIVLVWMIAPAPSNGSIHSCNFRCRLRPTLLDYTYPTGCYCHSTCGGNLPCCADQSYYCGPNGVQACFFPGEVRNAKVVGGQKLHYRIGETITYECDARYRLARGQGSRTCIFQDVWSPGPPRCEYS